MRALGLLESLPISATNDHHEEEEVGPVSFALKFTNSVLILCKLFWQKLAPVAVEKIRPIHFGIMGNNLVTCHILSIYHT